MIESPLRPTTLPRAPGFRDVRFVDVPKKRFFMIDGRGSPETDPAFGAAIQTLYPVGYTLKFGLKSRRGINVKVGALEGLFTTDLEHTGLDLAEPGQAMQKTDWAWTLMLPIPDEATDEEISGAVEDVRRKKAPPAIERLRVEAFHEGLCAEIKHVGPYSAEIPTIERLHAAIAAAGYRPRGRHHEIYIGDPNRSAPEKLKTLIRQPIE